MTDVRLAMTTVGSQEEAGRLANQLIEDRLAACVSIVPGVLSVYRWEGAVQQAQEWLLLIKTTELLVEALEARIAELHSYALPEFLVIRPDGGSAKYLAWVAQQTALLS